MKTFFDTSVLVAAMVESHSMHARALPWLKRAKEREFDWVVSSHSLAELYSVLTTLPVKPKISPGTARRLVRDNVESLAQVVSLTVSDYSRTIARVADAGLIGGIVYDALHARAASKAGIKRFLTFNPDDFRRAWPEGANVIKVP